MNNIVILPPKYKRMPGRLKNNRKRDIHEEESSHQLRANKKGVEITCQYFL